MKKKQNKTKFKPGPGVQPMPESEAPVCRCGFCGYKHAEKDGTPRPSVLTKQEPYITGWALIFIFCFKCGSLFNVQLIPWDDKTKSQLIEIVKG